MTRGARLRAKAHLLTLEVLQGLNARVFLGDKDRTELGVFFTLGNRYYFPARANLGLDMGEPTEPDEINLFIHERLDRCRIVIYRGKDHLHAQLFFEIRRQRTKLTHLFRCCFFGNGGDPQSVLGLGQCGGQKKADRGDA